MREHHAGTVRLPRPQLPALTSRRVTPQCEHTASIQYVDEATGLAAPASALTALRAAPVPPRQWTRTSV